MAYIEPCCADRQLPVLLKERHTVFFQTNGDVTVQKFMNAVGCLAGQPSDLWLMLPAVDIQLLRTIRNWFARGWLSHLHLLTQENQEDMVIEELCVATSGENASEENDSGSSLSPLPSSVSYAHDPLVLDGMMAFIGPESVVAIQGAMLTQVDFSLSLYATSFGSRQRYFDAPDGKVRMMLEPVISKMRVKQGKKNG